MSDLEGRVAVITGASRGVGRQLAIDLAAAGARVVVNYARSEAKAARVVEEIVAAGGQAFAYRADVSQAGDVEGMVAAALDAYGRIDLLVNNAAVNIDRPFLELSEADWDTVHGVNLKGAFLCSQAVGRAMWAAGSGRIVNIAAVTGINARLNAANFCPSKAGLIMLTKCVALELAPRVQVNCIAPGFFRSELVSELYSEAQIDAAVAATPLARMGELGELSEVVKFLASPAAAFITGQTLIVDGGRVMH